MSRSTDPGGTPAFCARVLEVMSAQLFDLGHGIAVKKTCSVGWAPYPWSRAAFEAICAEEVIALADAALYRAKALGRNQGVGYVPGDAVARNPETVDLKSVREGNPPLVHIVRTECPDSSSGVGDESNATDTVSDLRNEFSSSTDPA